jgi:hypothetical protein
VNLQTDKDKRIVLKPSRFINKELIPTNISERVVNWRDLTWLWLGMAAQMGVLLENLWFRANFSALFFIAVPTRFNIFYFISSILSLIMGLSFATRESL